MSDISKMHCTMIISYLITRHWEQNECNAPSPHAWPS